MTTTLLNSTKCDDWVLSMCPLDNHGLIASTTNGSLYVLPFDPSYSSPTFLKKFKIHNGSINKIKSIKEDPNLLISCSNDSTVKLWDFRQSIDSPVKELHNSRNLPFYSLDYNNGMIASGTELSGTDSELILWDLKNLDQPIRSFIDSHNDDITDIKFHPTMNNVLISGSTDGYVNIYDLNIEDENDALLQCITSTSIHSTGFLSKNRVFTLSHMETFSVYELNDFDNLEESNEPKPLEFGDIREKWGCEYVVDLYSPNYIVCGSNSKKEVKIYEFDPIKENFGKLKSPIYLPGGHGEEVVRDIVIRNNIIYTSGEDSYVKYWKSEGLENTEKYFFDDENKNQKEMEESMEVDTNGDIENSNSKTMKDKKEKKEKHKKKTKRFKPY